MNSSFIAALASGAFSSAVLVAGVNYFRDRKSLKAKGAVDEQTVELQVNAANMVVLGKRLDLVERAHDAERQAQEATISSLQRRLDSALSRIDILEQRVEFEDNRYRAAIRYIRTLRAWISRQVPGIDAPPIPAALEADFND